VALGVAPRLQPLGRAVPDAPQPDRPLDPDVVGAVLAAALPEAAIVVDEAVTARPGLYAATVGAAPHDWLALVGGAIGEGLPLATGAALAEPGRPVVSLEADGSAIYTLSALWTQARERLHVVTVILSNRAYAILQIEMQRVAGVSPGPAAAPLLALTDPELDFVGLAAGFGVPAARVETAGELARALQQGLSEPGPFLVDARLGPSRP
jgi:acetolactate synthase-1/2/3 large subunit